MNNPDIPESPQTPKGVCSMPLLADSPTKPYVLAFGERMEGKLALNRHKGNREGWINDDPEALLKRLREETRELEIAMNVAKVRMWEGKSNASHAADDVANEAADIANFAMMIADWYSARVG